MISSHFPVDYYQEKISLLYLKSRIVVMTTEDLLQYLLVDDHSLYVPALPAGPAGGEPEGGEGPGELGDAGPPTLVLLPPGGGGEQVAELRGGVVTSESTLLHLDSHIVMKSELELMRSELEWN